MQPSHSLNSLSFSAHMNSTLLPVVLSASNLLLSHGRYDSPELVHTIRTRVAHDTKMAMEETIIPFFTSTPLGRPIGFLRPQVLCAIEDHHALSGYKSPCHFYHSPETPGGGPWAVSFAAWVNEGGSGTRSLSINHLLIEWRAKGVFPSLL
jgi:hypothetical protein